jgi:diacylglycerol O-acyltransferase
MKQLNALDSTFLYMESDNQPMHIGGIGFYDQSTAPGGVVRFKRIIQTIKDRAHLAPLIRQRLVWPPMNMDYPYWINDDSFDPEFHIRHISLPKPGDWRQLCILASRIISRRLDRSHPLWEIYVIEGLDKIPGLPPNCFAILSKTHHACIDGKSSNDIGLAMADITPEIAIIPPTEPWIPDVKPTDLDLMMRTHMNNLEKPLRYLEFIQRTAPILAKANERLISGELKSTEQVPRTRFNNDVTPHRVFDGTYFSLQDFKDIKDTVPGATINDAVLAVCGGAMRKYLEEKNELPDSSLAAQCPVSVRTEDSTTGGNEVSDMVVLIRTDIEDPKIRLKAIAESSKDAKELIHAIGAKTMTDYSQFVPSALAALGGRIAAEQTQANSKVDPKFNTVITNVPGPQFPLYSSGAKYIRGFGYGPVINGNGLFHSVGSYCGEMSVSFSSCRKIMPDPANYTEKIRESFQELKDSTIGSPRIAVSNDKPIKKAAPKKNKAAVKN